MVSASDIYVASARVADALFKLGVPIKQQGVVRDGVRCFVFERRPEHHAAFVKVLGRGYT